MGNQQGGVKTTFSPLHGSNIELLREGVVATRKDKKSPSNAVLYTEHPVPLGCKFEVKLEEKVKYFNSNLKIGFTIYKPESSSDIAKSSDKLKTRFDHWILSGSSAWNGNVHWAVKYDLESLSQGDIIGCRVREGGRLCFYVNGEYKRYKGQALTNLPDNEPLYGFVDLCGDAIRVRALPIVDRSGGKGTGYSSGSLRRQHRTLPLKKYTLDPNIPAETKKKSGTLHISSSHNDDSINRSMTLAVDTSVQLFSMPSKRWNNRAFGCFHKKASPNITFKENGGVAIRKQPGKSNGFVFTQEPLRLEETFTVRLMELSGNYHVSLGIGITTLDPSSIEIPQSSLYLSHNPDYWVAITDTLRHIGNVHKLPFNLDTLKCKTKIGIMVKFNGDLHMFLNDKDEGKICGGVTTSKPLYGFVDLAGQAVKVRSMFYSAKSATTPYKEHGTEVEEVCQQIANEVVTLVTIYLQTENTADASVTHIERRNSLVETTLGRNWQTGSFTGSFSRNKNKGGSSKFTISFMEKLQHKVRSKQQSSADVEGLQQSLQKSLSDTKSDSTASEQKFTEEDEETMRQLLNPDTGDADDLASQIVDRIPDDVLNLLSMKFVPSQPETIEDPIESAHSIILEVLINAMSAELSDEGEPSASGKSTLQKQLSKSPAVKKKVSVTGQAGSIDKPEVRTNDGTTAASLQKQLSSSKSPALAKNISITGQTLSVDKPEADGTTTTPLINAQLMFSQITTTIACAVIEKLRKETVDPIRISDIPEDGSPLPFLCRPDDADKKTEHDQLLNGDKVVNTTNGGKKDVQPASVAPDDNVEYEEEMVIVTYGSFVNVPTKTDKPTMKEHVPDSTDTTTESTDTTMDNKPSDSTGTTVDKKTSKSIDTIMDKKTSDTTTDKKISESTDNKTSKSTDTTLDKKTSESTDTTTGKKTSESTDTTTGKKTSERTDTTTGKKTSERTDTTTGKKTSERTDTTMAVQDPVTAEMSAEQYSSLLVSLRPYLISQSDISSCMSQTGSAIPKGNTSGAFGTTIVKWFGTDCSLKEFNLDFLGKNKVDYGQYLTMCAALTKLRHPNIQQLLGFVSEDDTKPSASLVAELVDLTLTKLLADRKPDDLQASTHISIVYDVAKGVSYLHSSKMLHLLIRSDCVLVTRGYLAKLCDIADSQLYQCGMMSLSEPVNANYLPAAADMTHCSACDTFSVGVLTLQIITHTAPNPVSIDDEFQTEIQRRQSQIDLVHSSHPLLPLILNCLANKPDDRPTDKEICSFLETALKSKD